MQKNEDILSLQIINDYKSYVEIELNACLENNRLMKLELEEFTSKNKAVKNINLEKIFEIENDYVLINSSGEGKTTFLYSTAYELLNNYKEYEYFPLVFRAQVLNTLEEKTPLKLIREEIESRYNNSESLLIKDDWKNLCILIDGLDQLQNIDEILQLLQVKDYTFNKAKIILTSRENTAYPIPNYFKKLKLKAPSPEEIENYLEKPDDEVIKQIIKENSDIVKTPVLLWKLRTVIESTDVSLIIKEINMANLNEYFLQALISKERKQARPKRDRNILNNFIENKLEPCLEKLAYKSMQESKFIEITSQDFKNYGIDINYEKEKEILLNIGIIIEPEPLKIQFRHQSLQAYFAAKYIVNEHEIDGIITLIDNLEYFYDDAWQEVICFCFELISTKDNFVQNILKSLSEKEFDNLNAISHLKNIIKCSILFKTLINNFEVIRTIKGYLQKIINSKYFGIFLNNIDKFNAKNEFQNEFLSDIANLLWSIEKYSTGNCPDIIVKIFHLFSKTGINVLLSQERINFYKNHISCEVRESFANLLGQIEQEIDKSIFLELLNDENEDVKTNAFISLIKKIDLNNFDIEIPEIYNYHNADTDTAENFALESTVKDIFLNKYSGDELNKLLKNKNFCIRKIAIDCILSNTKNPEELKSLIKDFSDKLFFEFDARLNFTAGEVEILEYPDAEIEESEKVPDFFIEKIEELLTHDDPVIREKAVNFLVEDCECKAETITPLLKDDDDDVKISVISALGEIGSSEHADLIRPFLDYDNSKYSDFRIYVIKALGKIGNPSDIPLILGLIEEGGNDYENFNCKDVEIALKKLGAAEDIINRYFGTDIQIQEDKNFDFVFDVIDSEGSYNIFFDLINNKDEQVINIVSENIRLCKNIKFLKGFITESIKRQIIQTSSDVDLIYDPGQQAIEALCCYTDSSDIDFLDKIIKDSERWDYIYPASIAINKLYETEFRNNKNFNEFEKFICLESNGKLEENNSEVPRYQFQKIAMEGKNKKKISKIQVIHIKGGKGLFSKPIVKEVFEYLLSSNNKFGINPNEIVKACKISSRVPANTLKKYIEEINTVLRDIHCKEGRELFVITDSNGINTKIPY